MTTKKSVTKKAMPSHPHTEHDTVKDEFLDNLEAQADRRDLRGRVAALENFCQQLGSKLRSHGIHVEPLE